MAERAGELIEEEEQAFPMYDEDAQNHFGAIDGIDWTFYLERSSFIRRYGERRENYRRKPRRRISSICEHVLLTKWQDSNAKVNRADSIRLKLPRSELMELIVRNFLMLYERFTDGGGLREIPEYAVHLGLAAPTPGVQLPSHAPPLIALEQFRYQVARTLDEITCEQLGWATYELSMSSPDECSDALAVLAQSFPQIIRTYKGYVSTAAARRADGSRIPSIDELLELTHCALPLLALLRARNFSTIPITVALWGAFRYFFVHGRGRVSTLAGYLLLNMRRCSEPEFRNEFRLALVFAPSSTPNSCGDGPAFNAAACRALSAEVRQRHFLHVIS